ncbi:MAG: hypothetical protein Q7U51_03495 [Methanoregula sp.]|nr:hypothetical protein [Methanoregula sp.]
MPPPALAAQRMGGPAPEKNFKADTDTGKYPEAIRAFNKGLKIHPHEERAREQSDLAQTKFMVSAVGEWLGFEPVDIATLVPAI